MQRARKLLATLAVAAALPTASFAAEPCGAVVYFPLDVSALNADVQSAIQQVMQQDPDATVSLIGYADALGSTGYNARLSGARAQNVANYIKQIAPAATIDQVAAGGELPGTGANPVDRRVEIRLPGCTAVAAAPTDGGLGTTAAAAALGLVAVAILLSDSSDDSTTTTTTTTGTTTGASGL